MNLEEKTKLLLPFLCPHADEDGLKRETNDNALIDNEAVGEEANCVEKHEEEGQIGCGAELLRGGARRANYRRKEL